VIRATVVLSLIAWLAACASTPESGVLPPDDQFARAEQEFADGNFRQAIADFQTFAFNYPQDPRVPEARWKTAQGFYEVEDWATAAQEYLNYQRDYPRDERAAESLFQAGRAYQEMSLRPELDQRETERAVNAYDRVIVEYPRSGFVEEARTRKAQLRDKLAEKAYLNAEFYFDNENYVATEIYLTDLIEQYTDTAWIPTAYALLARSKCEQGLGDRASEVYARLRENYPDSQAVREVQGELPASCRSTRASSDSEAPARTNRR
jgi:outer membrane protein assembly factor BamD